MNLDLETIIRRALAEAQAGGKDRFKDPHPLFRGVINFDLRQFAPFMPPSYVTG